MDEDPRIGFEVARRLRRKPFVHLEGIDATARLDEERQHCRVIAAARAHMDDVIARLRVDDGEPCRMQCRLAVVDAVLPVEGDEDVIVDVPEIARLRRDPGADRRPGRRPEKGLPRNAGEDLPDPRVIDLGERHDALRITRPKLLRTEDLTHA